MLVKLSLVHARLSELRDDHRLTLLRKHHWSPLYHLRCHPSPLDQRYSVYILPVVHHVPSRPVIRVASRVSLVLLALGVVLRLLWESDLHGHPSDRSDGM